MDQKNKKLGPKLYEEEEKKEKDHVTDSSDDIPSESGDAQAKDSPALKQAAAYEPDFYIERYHSAKLFKNKKNK